MSLPICIAAKILNLKIFLFEPNLVLGRANLFLLNYCNKIFTYSKNIKKLPKKMGYKNFVIKPIIRKNIFLAKNKLKVRKQTSKRFIKLFFYNKLQFLYSINKLFFYLNFTLGLKTKV